MDVVSLNLFIRVYVLQLCPNLELLQNFPVANTINKDFPVTNTRNKYFSVANTRNKNFPVANTRNKSCGKYRKKRYEKTRSSPNNNVNETRVPFQAYKDISTYYT